MNHQDDLQFVTLTRVEMLEMQCRLVHAEEIIKFYSDEENYGGSQLNGAGDRAREYLKRWEKK